MVSPPTRPDTTREPPAIPSRTLWPEPRCQGPSPPCPGLQGHPGWLPGDLRPRQVAVRDPCSPNPQVGGEPAEDAGKPGQQDHLWTEDSGWDTQPGWDRLRSQLKGQEGPSQSVSFKYWEKHGDQTRVHPSTGLEFKSQKWVMCTQDVCFSPCWAQKLPSRALATGVPCVKPGSAGPGWLAGSELVRAGVAREATVNSESGFLGAGRPCRQTGGAGRG